MQQQRSIDSGCAQVSRVLGAICLVVGPLAAVAYELVTPVDAGSANVARQLAEVDVNRTAYTLGKTWTTDAPYRETRAKIDRRRHEGCITVEMESAAFIAVASHRGVRFAQMLYAGDDLSGEAWDQRSWTTSSARRDQFWLGVESALNL